MYSSNDPRAGLPTSTAVRSDEPIAALQTYELLTLPPTEVSDRGSRTWYVRGQNFVLAFSRAVAGDPLRRTQPHEYVIVAPQDGQTVAIEHASGAAALRDSGVVIVPGGDSAVTLDADAEVVRLFDLRSTDLLPLCHNADSYREAHPRVAPLHPWPDPVDGPRVRVYRNADHPVEQGRFGRIFRSSAFMVNFGDPKDGPRDPDRMSPHHHDDFEQCSLTVAGDYVHHVRTPWTSKRSQWLPDEHAEVGSPAVTIIPPPTVHTSQAMGAGRHQLIDIFSPPRADFSAKPGWVRNADEYPAPAHD
ncbi:cupin domain-containing protein [Actinophytocola sediminis]